MAKTKKPFYKRVWFWLIAIIVVLGVGLGSGDEEPTSGGSKADSGSSENQEEEEKEEGQEEQEEFKIGETISYKDFDLIFENQREVEEITGNGSYLVLDVTINSKKDNLRFTGDVQGVTDDNEVISDTIPFVEEDLGDSIMAIWTKKLNDGQKAKGYIAFDKEIDIIEIRSNAFKNDVITVTLD